MGGRDAFHLTNCYVHFMKRRAALFPCRASGVLQVLLSSIADNYVLARPAWLTSAERSAALGRKWTPWASSRS